MRGNAGGMQSAHRRMTEDREDNPQRGAWRRNGRQVRVAIVAEQLRRRVPGGIGTYIKGLVMGLTAIATRGEAVPEVTLVASRPPHGEDPLRALGLPVLTSAIPGPLMVRAWMLGIMRGPRGFDILHSASMASPPGGFEVRVMTVHDLAWRKFPDAFPPRGQRWHERALARAISSGTSFVVPSDAVAQDLLDVGVGEGRVTVVGEGSDHLPSPDGQAASALLARLGVPEIEGGYILAVGTLEPRKNLQRLIEAYSMSHDRLPVPWPLVVVGPSGWGPGVVPAPGVFLAGSVDDATLAGLYAGARLLAYVPLAEGFGLPPVEAMRAGLPVLASPVPSTAGAAFEVDPLDVHAIADGLVAVSSDESLRESLRQAGRLRAAGCTWEAAARRHLHAWDAAMP